MAFIAIVNALFNEDPDEYQETDFEAEVKRYAYMRGYLDGSRANDPSGDRAAHCCHEIAVIAAESPEVEIAVASALGWPCDLDGGELK